MMMTAALLCLLGADPTLNEVRVVDAGAFICAVSIEPEGGVFYKGVMVDRIDFAGGLLMVDGIDPPHVDDADPTVADWAVKARDHVAHRVRSARRITVRNLVWVCDPDNPRFRAQVTIDGIDLGADLIQMGFARPYDEGDRYVPWTAADCHHGRKGR